MGPRARHGRARRTVEEVGEELDDFGDAGGAADKDDVVHLVLGHLGVAEHLLDRLHGAAEEVHVELLEARARDRREEVDALEERVDLDRGLGRRGEGALGALARGAQAAHGTRVARQVLLMLALELLHEVVDGAVVEVLAAQVGVARGRLHLEDALLDGEERNVECAAAKVKDEHVALGGGLLVEAVGDGSGGGLVDDTQHIQTRDRTRVLGRGALRVVEVGGNGDHRIVDLLAKVGLGNLLHLDEHHGGDLLGEELLLLTLVVHLDARAVAVLGEDTEGEVLEVGLRRRVRKATADQTLGVEDGVDGVHRGL